MYTQETLQQRFKATWMAAVNTRDTDADRACQVLFEHLNGEKRFYHGPQHVRQCLIEFDRVADQLEVPLAVELAVWFHDFIYHSESGHDERESAENFAVLAETSLPRDLIDAVSVLIIATEHRNEISAGNSDIDYLLDIDLSSLGAEWDKFMRDGSDLRKEQAELSDQEYYRNKTNFFDRLQQQDNIFKTTFFQQRYEKQARSNLLRHRAWLQEEMPEVNITVPE